MAQGLHISISAEPLTTIGELTISNSIFTSLIVSFLLIAIAFVARSSIKDERRPQGLQNFFEWVVESLFGLVEGIAGSKKKAKAFFPFIATFFLFILLNNWFGLLPGVGTIGFIEGENTEHAQLQESGLELESSKAYASELAEEHRQEAEAAMMEESEHVESEGDHGAVFVPYLRAGTADLNGTLALGLISIVVTQFFGFKYLGLSYLKKYFNFSNPIMFFVGILELISEFAKIISFAFRLFGNIFAGEVLLVVMLMLGKVIIPMPFYGLEIFVGFIQALVFAMLSLVFFNMATIGHDDH